jgi:tripartite-type tricarboxylate transporter receptor subunit TctC
MVHVPYRGTTPALQDIMGGTVDVFFDNLGSSLSLHFGGELHVGVGAGRAVQVQEKPPCPPCHKSFHTRSLIESPYRASQL